jgi:FkbM family methyltransferase
MFFNYNQSVYNIELPEHLAEQGSPLQIPHIIKIEGNLIAKALNENTKWNTFVDVGASEGLWTINMAKYFEHVIAIEPYPLAYEILKKNTKSLSNVKILHHALAQKAFKKYKMITGPSFNIGMTKRLNDFALLDRQMIEQLGSKIFYCKAETLDSLELKNVDMIKIDAEGEEKNVLKGAKKTIEKFSPQIIVDN